MPLEQARDVGVQMTAKDGAPFRLTACRLLADSRLVYAIARYQAWNTSKLFRKSSSLSDGACYDAKSLQCEGSCVKRRANPPQSSDQSSGQEEGAGL